MDSENKEIILVGNFNADWANSKNTAQTKALIDITNEFQFKLFIDEPTRITESTTSTIDPVFSNRPEIIITSGVDHINNNYYHINIHNY